MGKAQEVKGDRRLRPRNVEQSSANACLTGFLFVFGGGWVRHDELRGTFLQSTL